MDNPFVDVKIEPEVELTGAGDEQQQKLAKREEIYARYNPLVTEILDQLIAAQRQGIWEKDSDCTRLYCCHIAWFAGPREKFFDPYDAHHTIRRRIEIKLEMDGFCNPTGFTVTNYEAIEKTIHVGLEKEDLIRGIKAVMD